MIRRILTVLVTALLVGLIATTPSGAVATWTTGTASWENPLARQPHVIDLRYARHSNYDRVVIDISGRLPGYTTGWTRTHTYDGSGEPVPILGGLWISLFPAYAHDDAGRSTYDGPTLVRPGFPALKAIAFTGDYEGYVSFAFGLDGRNPYRIMRLHDPQRIVIDFRHAS
jgi:hypothetical protein